MQDELLELDLDVLEKRGINRYQAVLMASQEARFLNDQIHLGIIDEVSKPTTVAIKRLFDGLIVVSDDTENPA